MSMVNYGISGSTQYSSTVPAEVNEALAEVAKADLRLSQVNGGIGTIQNNQQLNMTEHEAHSIRTEGWANFGAQLALGVMETAAGAYAFSGSTEFLKSASSMEDVNTKIENVEAYQKALETRTPESVSVADEEAVTPRSEEENAVIESRLNDLVENNEAQNQKPKEKTNEIFRQDGKLAGNLTDNDLIDQLSDGQAEQLKTSLDSQLEELNAQRENQKTTLKGLEGEMNKRQAGGQVLMGVGQIIQSGMTVLAAQMRAKQQIYNGLGSNFATQAQKSNQRSNDFLNEMNQTYQLAPQLAQNQNFKG